MHDIKLTYFCDNTWDIVATLHPTVYSHSKPAANDTDLNSWGTFANRAVDPDQNCKLLHPDAELIFGDIEDEKRFNETSKLGLSREEYFSFKRENGHWTNIMLYLFSMKVATGFIAAYTPTTFYLVLVYGLATAVRTGLIFNTWMGYTYE